MVHRLPGGTSGKEPTGQMQEIQETWVGKIPCRRKWQPTPVFLPGESHGQRSLVGYSPWGCKESDKTERLTHTHTHTHTHTQIPQVKEFILFSAYGKIQDSGFTEIIPFKCISALRGQHPAFLTSQSPIPIPSPLPHLLLFPAAEC